MFISTDSFDAISDLNVGYQCNEHEYWTHCGKSMID